MEEQLRTAAILGKKDDLKRLVEQPGINLNYRDKEGSTALYHASSQGYPKLVQILLDKGADPSIKNNNGYTPQDRASNKSVKNVFLDHADPNRPKGWFSSWFGGKKADPKPVSKAVEPAAPSTTPPPIPTANTTSSAAHADLAKQLYNAAESNDTAKMRTLLQTSIGIINFQNDNKETALLQAAYKGQLDAVRLLIEKGANMNLQDKFERTALHWASSEGHVAIVKLLLEKGANIAIKNRHGQLAHEIGKTQQVKDLFGGKPSAGSTTPPPTTSTTSTPASAAANELGQKLYDAANSADLTKLRELLNTSGININWVNANGESALIQACYKGHTAVVQQLLDKNCNMNIKEKDGWTALHWASTKGHMDILRLLLQKGADASIKKNNGSTPPEIGKDQAVKDLFAAFASGKGSTYTSNTSTSSTSSNTPPPAANSATAAALGQKLYDAANSADIPKLKELLNTSGININWVNGNGESALLQASYKGHLAVCELLTEKKADLNIKEKDGWTALHWAAYKGHLAVTKLLLEKGADHTIRKNNGSTPLEIATNQATKDVFTAFFSKKTGMTSTPTTSPSKPTVTSTPTSTNPVPQANIDAALGPKLWDAANAGEVEKVRTLLGTPRINIDYVNANQETSLIQACYKGHTAVVQLLLAMGANKNMKDKDGWTALHWASTKGHMDILRLLLQKGADASIKKNNGSTPLDCAKDQAVKDLFAQYAPKTTSTTTSAPAPTPAPAPQTSNTNTSTSGGFDAALGPRLWDAANAGEVEKVRTLLGTSRINIDYTNENGETALIQTCYKGHTAVVQLLLAMGANKNMKDKDGWTALHWASTKGHIDILRLLLQKGADASIRKNNGSTPLDCAKDQAVQDLFTQYAPKSGSTTSSSANVPPTPPAATSPGLSGDALGQKLYDAANGADLPKLRELLNTPGVNINWVNGNKESALIQASFKGHANVVELLLSKNANMNFKEKDGWTALHWAAYKAHLPVLQLLLDKGADITIKKNNGLTALESCQSNQAVKDLFAAHAQKKLAYTPAQLGAKLYAAAESGELDTIRTLLSSSGVNINFQNETGETALLQACYKNQLASVKLLIEHGANVNLQTNDGWSALHWAAFKAHASIVELLLEKGADTTLKKKSGTTAAEVATDAKIKALFTAHASKKSSGSSTNTSTPSTPNTKPSSNSSVPPIPAPSGPTLTKEQETELGNKLYEAASKGDVNKVRELLNTPGININFKYQNSETALIQACYEGHLPVAQLLVEKGANLNLKDSDGWTALHWAAYKTSVPLTTLLLEKGADITMESKKGSTALEATRDPAIIEAFAAHARKKNPSSSPLKPAATTTVPKVAAPMTEAEMGEKLCEAATSGNTNTVREMLNTAGCNVNFTLTATGESAMLKAATGGHVEVLQLLLDKGADVNLQDKGGRTAMHNACIHARIDAARLLIKRGANHYVLDKDGLPPPQSNAAIKKIIDDYETLLQPKMPSAK